MPLLELASWVEDGGRRQRRDLEVVDRKMSINFKAPSSRCPIMSRIVTVCRNHAAAPLESCCPIRPHQGKVTRLSTTLLEDIFNFCLHPWRPNCLYYTLPICTLIRLLNHVSQALLVTSQTINTRARTFLESPKRLLVTTFVPRLHNSFVLLQSLEPRDRIYTQSPWHQAEHPQLSGPKETPR